MRRLTMTPRPDMQFGLPLPDHGNTSVQWAPDWYEHPNGTTYNVVKLMEHRWRVSYWWLWLQVWRHGEVKLHVRPRIVYTVRFAP